MAAELVNAATNEKLTEIDWTKNIEICELVARDPRHTKDVIRAIKKRLGSKNGNTQLLAASLLETLMNNIGEPVHKQVIDNRIIPILLKIVKAKSELPVREKIFLLLDAAQTSVGGASGKFPQYYTAYYELVTAGVKFPQRAVQTYSNGVHSSPPAKEPIAVQPEKIATEVEGPHPSDPRILEKAGTALEVLREVLAAIDSRHPEAAKDEFTLDLVEQCSFHKQKVMQLAMNSRDDKVVSQAIDLNEQLQRVLRKHDALVSIEPTSVANHLPREEEEHEEEEPEQLFRRLRKGKAHVRPEDEEHPADRPFGLLSSPVLSEIPHRPLIRPLTVEPKKEVVRPLTVEPKKEVVRPLAVEPKKEVVRPLPVEKKQEDVRPFSVEPSPEPVGKAVVSIPPPPAKHVERERFFQQKKTDGSSVSGHMRGLSLHSRNASSSGSGSADFSSETFL